MNDTQESPSAARLEAIMRLLLSAETDEELAQAQEQAQALADMSDEEVQALLAGEGAQPQAYGRGDFLRSSFATQYAALPPLRVPQKTHIGDRQGGEFVGAETLARFYAELYTDMAHAGSPPDEDEMAASNHELNPHKWGVEPDEEGGYDAVNLIHKNVIGREEEEEQPQQFLRSFGDGPLMYASHAIRCPPGHKMTLTNNKGETKTYKGGEFIPKKDLANAEPEQKKAIEEAAAKSEAKAAGKKQQRDAKAAPDKAKLKERTQKHAPPSLSASEMKSAKASWSALSRIHGDKAIHRIEELVEQAEKAMARVKGAGTAADNKRNPLRKQLAKLAWMLEQQPAKADAKAPEAPAERPPADMPKDEQPSASPRGKLDKSLHPEGRAILDQAVKNIRTNGNLSADQRKEYFQATQDVLLRMPAEAAVRIRKNLPRGPEYVASKEDVRKALVSRHPKAASLAGNNIGGFYSLGATPRLVVDGGIEKVHDLDKGGRNTVRGVYAHEFTHAIDGPKHELSESADWQAAFKAEIAGGALNRYAAKKPAEGLAEFGRLLYAGDHDIAEVKQRFPLCHRFFADKGFFAEQPVRHAKGKPVPEEDGKPFLDELFSRSVDGDDFHADELIDDEPPRKPKDADQYLRRAAEAARRGDHASARMYRRQAEGR